MTILSNLSRCRQTADIPQSYVTLGSRLMPILKNICKSKHCLASYEQFNIHLITECNAITCRDAKQTIFVNKLKTVTPVVGSRLGSSIMPLKSCNCGEWWQFGMSVSQRAITQGMTVLLDLFRGSLLPCVWSCRKHTDIINLHLTREWSDPTCRNLPWFFFHCKSTHNKIHCQNFSC
jgi:hypothetical protein